MSFIYKKKLGMPNNLEYKQMREFWLNRVLLFWLLYQRLAVAFDTFGRLSDPCFVVDDLVSCPTFPLFFDTLVLSWIKLKPT